MLIIYELEKRKKHEYIDDCLLSIRFKGRFSFTFDELKNVFDPSKQAVRKKKIHLKADSIIATIRKDFYIVLSPEYAENGTFPVYLYIDELMRYLKKDYDISLYFAVALYGADHQHMEYQINVQQPIRDFVVGNTKNSFFSNMEEKMIDREFLNDIFIIP